MKIIYSTNPNGAMAHPVIRVQDSSQSQHCHRNSISRKLGDLTKRRFGLPSSIPVFTKGPPVVTTTTPSLLNIIVKKVGDAIGKALIPGYETARELQSLRELCQDPSHRANEAEKFEQINPHLFPYNG